MWLYLERRKEALQIFRIFYFYLGPAYMDALSL